MDRLKKLIELAQRHYEKVALGLALLALGLAGLFLASLKEKETAGIEEFLKDIAKRKSFMYTNIDWTVALANLEKGTNPVTVDFKRPRLHNLFGPVKWQMRPDHTLIKVELGNEVGADAVKVVRITPLYLTISLEKAGGGSIYYFGLVREASTNAVFRRKQQTLASRETKDRFGVFVLKDVKGPAEAPTELSLELIDGSEPITVTKDKPFQRVDGYKVDLSYPPEQSSFTDKRVNDSITLGGEEYNIVAITQNEVVLSARANGKRTTLRYNAAP